MKRIILLTGLLYSVFSVKAQSASDTVVYGNNAKAGTYANIRGFKMYYETYGQGEPLLIIHGNGGSIKDFTFQIPFFSQHYKVILADSRAQGKSVETGDTLSYEMMADDLSALLDVLKIDSANVIGWSDGGINGLLLAMRHPSKVKKLAVTGANLSPDKNAVDAFAATWAGRIYDSILKVPTTPDIKFQRKLFRLLATEPHISTTDLARIKCPALIIGGDHDVIRPEHTLLIYRSIPNAYLWILPNSGHSTPVYYKDQFNQVVYNFFMQPYRKIEKFGTFN